MTICAHCNLPFKPDKKARRFCSLKCSAGAQSAARLERIAAAAPNCEVCGNKVEPWRGESIAQLGARRFCSPACHGAGQVVVLPPTKECRGCRNTFAKKPHTSYRDWKGQNYCSKQCRPRRQIAKATRQKLAKHAKGHGITFAHRQAAPEPARFQSVEDWLKHHRPTICPPRYAAPVMGAGAIATGAPPQAGLNRQSMTAAAEHPANP